MKSKLFGWTFIVLTSPLNSNCTPCFSPPLPRTHLKCWKIPVFVQMTAGSECFQVHGLNTVGEFCLLRLSGRAEFWAALRTPAELSLGVFSTLHNRCWSSEDSPGLANASLLETNRCFFAGGETVGALFSPLTPPCSSIPNPLFPALFAWRLSSSHQVFTTRTHTSIWVTKCLIPVFYTHLWWT